MQTREQTLHCWLKTMFTDETYTLTPINGDASFRQYFRLKVKDKSYVVMDAPPEKEPIGPFLKVQSILKEAQIQVPECIASEPQQGFILLSDLGDQLLLYSLTPENTDSSYQNAIETLIQLQHISHSTLSTLPPFNDVHIQQELGLFQTWFLEKHLNLSLTPSEIALIKASFNLLTESLIKQPQIFIHRDYHSRNIMRLADHTLGIIDFQDAMLGPWTYDLVSLLKDCYIQWPDEKRKQWTAFYYQQSRFAETRSYEQFHEDFELCGLQRHLKVLGIFARLAIRDHKTQFLNDLPLTLHYVQTCLAQQPKLQNFADWINERAQLS